MKKPFIITLLLLLSSLILRAQDSIPSHHAQPDSVIKIVPFDVGSHTSYLYTIGGKIQTPEDVKIRIMAYAPSAEEYYKAKTAITWSYVSGAGFVASSALAIIQYAHNNKMAGAVAADVNGQPGFIYQHHSLTSAYVFTSIATAFFTSAIINFIHAAKHSNKALKLYNQRFE